FRRNKVLPAAGAFEPSFRRIERPKKFGIPLQFIASNSAPVYRARANCAGRGHRFAPSWKGGPAMLTNISISYVWHAWVGGVATMGLPIDTNVTAFVALIAVFYGIGRGFKALVSREK